MMDAALIGLTLARALGCGMRNRAGLLATIELMALCTIAMVRASSPTSTMNVGQVRGAVSRMTMNKGDK